MTILEATNHETHTLWIILDFSVIIWISPI